MGLHPFTTYVLRNYYHAAGWNEDNLYSNLTRSSDAILGFTVPRGLQFSISKAPNALFRTTYSMNTLPSLRGTIGYIFTSCDLDLKSSGDVRFKDMVERFRVYDQPQRPEGKPEEWLAGRRVDVRDYLLSGLLYIPTGRLDAFYSTRLSRTLQASVSAINEARPTSSRGKDSDVSSGNLLLSIQHDTGRWCTEYTWDSEGSVWGLRVLRNFGKLATNTNAASDDPEWTASGTGGSSKTGLKKRVDEEEAMEGGLKGRISAGAEFYVSAEKSAGVSTGIRFTTLPDATPPSFNPRDSLSTSSLMTESPYTSESSLPSEGPHSQPPTTITALINPITGHILTAYAARVSRDLALCSQFAFNINSYESEWTMGAEWWMRRKGISPDTPTSDSGISHDVFGERNLPQIQSNKIQGVVKARLSTSADIAFMWEGRLRNALISLGVMSNLSNRSKPITAIGLELAYFSSD